MKILIALSVIIGGAINIISAQCTCLYSFEAYFNNVTFINQSSISNAHYFWNFGDGTGSNFSNPIHTFPGTGDYLVTLFGLDTISNCSAYYEYWINVTKYTSDTCKPSISDTLFTYQGRDFVQILDQSTNCNGYFILEDVGPAQNTQLGNWIWFNDLQTIPWLMVGRAQYFWNDTAYGQQLLAEAYKTIPFIYSSSKNYNNCSANFEFTVISDSSTGQTLLLKAMNKNAAFYQWSIAGFGNPIFLNTQSATQFYPYNGDLNDLWIVSLAIRDSSGCVDTLCQNILIANNISTVASTSEVQNQIHYNLFPNPFSQEARLEFPTINGSATLDLYSTLGQPIRTFNNITGNQLIIYRDALPSGLYFFTLRTNEQIIASGKLVAE